MKEWKIKQEIYHRLYKEYSDDLNKIEVTISDNIAETALRHFNERVEEFIYPAKSYFVAFCYAYWISVDYKEDFLELLKDPMLLAGNDPYYKTYDEDSETYDFLIARVNLPIAMVGMVPDVREYYNAEFGY